MSNLENHIMGHKNTQYMVYWDLQWTNTAVTQLLWKNDTQWILYTVKFKQHTITVPRTTSADNIIRVTKDLTTALRINNHNTQPCQLEVIQILCYIVLQTTLQETYNPQQERAKSKPGVLINNLVHPSPWGTFQKHYSGPSEIPYEPYKIDNRVD